MSSFALGFQEIEKTSRITLLLLLKRLRKLAW